MTIEERMESGKLYNATDERLQAQQKAANELVYDYNATRPGETEKRLELLGRIFAEVGEGCWIEPPLRANWGTHTHLGNHVYANFNLTLVDDTQVTIGDYVMIGPGTLITTANHPCPPRAAGSIWARPSRFPSGMTCGSAATARSCPA